MELFHRARLGDEEAMEQLVKENEGLVVHVASRFFHRGQEAEDLIQIGMIGLVKAIRGFDEERGFRFSTYAVPMIMGEIRRFLRDDGVVKVSRSLRENGWKIRSFQESFEKQWGREPNLSEIAEHTGLSIEEITLAQGVFVKTVPYPEVEETLGDEELVSHALLAASLGTLSPSERRLIGMRYYLDMPQSKVAEVIGTSQVSVSRMEKKILKSLRSCLE